MTVTADEIEQLRDAAGPGGQAMTPDWREHLVRLKACADAIEWAHSRSGTAADAWAACERGDWLLWVAARTGVDRRLVAFAACDCARPALDYVPAGEHRPRAAIETVEAWARGEASLGDVRAAAAAAYASAATAATAAYATVATAYAATAAYAVAAAAAAAAADVATATTAASAATAAARAASATATARAASHRRSAELVRARISLALLEEARQR